MFLAGKWVSRSSTIEVSDPQDGSFIALVPRANASDALLALEVAHAARREAHALPVHLRKAILRKAASTIEHDQDRYADLIAREGIKTIREARLEVARCIATFDLAAEEAARLSGETIAFDQRPGSERRTGYDVRQPIGVVLGITPFNDPLNLVAHKVASAIAAGNSIILKPHRRTPLSALELARALQMSGLPDGILQVLTGSGAELGRTLVPDPRVRMVSFTGGYEAGAQIAAMAGPKKMTMELGGNCPTIIMPDADLKKAVPDCVSGAFWAAGQNCLHVQRLFVHRDVYRGFREEFVAAASRYTLGPKRDEATDMGCIVDETSAARIEAGVRSAQAKGAKVLTGGGRLGTRMEPTVVEDVPGEHDLMRQETYGPVTALVPFSTFDEAIEKANDCDYGLHAAIFTANLENAFNAIDRLEAGAVLINSSTDYRIDAMPFGGVKKSGIGREGVRQAMLEMTEIKVVCFNRG
jgi:glyceraldehyde-3-phosphate dehydrogenase (NADP+)